MLRIREDSNDAWGGRKIAQVLKRDRGQIAPAPSTITQILRRHGKLEQRASEHPGPYQRFVATRSQSSTIIRAMRWASRRAPTIRMVRRANA